MNRSGQRPRPAGAAAGGRSSGTWAVALAVLAGLVVRLHDLGARGLWVDEGFTWHAATQALPELLRLCMFEDESPPLFYLLAGGAFALRPDEAGLRLVSALASTAMVWLTYRFARLAAGRPESVLAASLCALSPFQVAYAQEARNYALVSMLGLGSLYLFVRAVLLDRPRAWTAWIVVTALGLWTQAIMILLIGAQAMVALATRGGRSRFWRWAMALAAAAALYAPWALFSLTQTHRVSGSHWYIDAPSVMGTARFLRTLFVSPVPLVTPDPATGGHGLALLLGQPLAWASVAAAYLLALGAALPSLRPAAPRSAVLWTAVAGIVVPLGTIFVLSFFSSLWLPRFFVFAGPLAAILLARGCFALRVRALGGVVAAALLLIQGYGLFRYDRAYQKEPWRDVAREVRSLAAGQPATVLAMFDAEAFSFYLRDGGHQVEVVEMSHPDVIANAGYREEQLDEMETRAQRRTEGSREVWVIGGSLITPDRREAFDRAVRVAGTGREHRASERWRWHGSTSAVRVERFVRRDPATPASPPPATVERRAPR